MSRYRELRHIMSVIRRVLRRREHLHLLKPAWRRMHEEHRIPASTGFCSIAAEALYHLAGGQGSGLKPYRRSYKDGTTHWWLVDGDGRVWDPTADQFGTVGDLVGYREGRAGGFPTPRQGLAYQPPSKRAAELIAAVLKEMGEQNPGHPLPSVVYHGTHNPENFTMLGSPGWVTDELEAAEYYAKDYYDTTQNSQSRVLVYAFKAAPRLLYFGAGNTPDMQALADIWEAETGKRLSTEPTDYGSDLIEAFYTQGDRLPYALMLCRHGYDGWYMPGALEADGADIMICQPKKFLKYISTEML